MDRCESCGAENPEGFRFCGHCGAPLVAEGAEVRKLVTVVFSDVTGSTSLGERLDSESLRGVMSRYFDVARTVLERHGGTVEKFIGDAVMAVFGVPEVHEDDALRAARAALELRERLDDLNDELERGWGARVRIRTGINSGEVVAGDHAAGQAFVSGDAVNVAARLEQAAEPGEILIGEETLRLTRDAVRVEAVEPLSLKGKSEPVAAFRLLEASPDLPAFARRLDSPMVGRDLELAQLMEVVDRVGRTSSCELVTVLGVAGVGKSRLIRELAARLGDRARILEGRCLPYGDGITFWPVGEIVREAAGIGEHEMPDVARAKIRALVPDAGSEADLIAERVATAIGLGEAGGVIQETFWAIRRLLETLADGRPLIAVIDDLHWAAPTLLDLIEYVAGFSRGHPLVLLCMARHELREERPDWGRDGTTVALRPLPPGDSDRLVRNLLGEGSLPDEVQARVVGSAEGNPLFVEEMLRMLIDDGFLRRDDGRWVAGADLSGASAPATIQALISARLDRLRDEERAVMQRASVVGKIFYWGAVTDLSPQESRGDVGENLQTLVRRELILPELSALAGQDAFRFSHILVHDAAYASTPKRARADLHERFASWLERTAGPRRSEFEEIVGYHHEQAYRYLAELGPVDDHGLAVATRAAASLAAAGRRAEARGDLAAAASLLRRATDLLPADDPARVELLPELGVALMETGAWSEAEAVLMGAIADARALGDRRTEGRAVAKALWLQLHTGRFESNREALPDLERTLATLDELGDDPGLSDAWILRGSIDFWSGRGGRAVEAADRAVEHARRAHDGRRELGALRLRTYWQLWGPTPAEEVTRAIQELLAGPVGADPVFGMQARRALAVAEAMRGNLERGRELAEASAATARELGLQLDYTSGLTMSGFVAMLRGDPVAAERSLAEAVAIFRAMGDVGHLSSWAPHLADVLYAQERYVEALTLTEEAERVSIDSDTDAEVHWRRVRGKILARTGRIDEALPLATQAVDIARASDDLEKRGRVLLDLAEVLHLAGRPSDDVARVLREAVDVYGRKGNVVMAARARERLAETGSA